MSSVECWVSSVECRVSSVECWVSSVECRVLGVECWVLGAGCRVSNFQCLSAAEPNEAERSGPDLGKSQQTH